MSELSWLPRHKAGLALTHNEYLTYHQTAEEFCDERDEDNFVPGERERIIETGEVWEVHWYPETPVGFCRIAASSIEALRGHFAPR